MHCHPTYFDFLLHARAPFHHTGVGTSALVIVFLRLLITCWRYSSQPSSHITHTRTLRHTLASHGTHLLDTFRRGLRPQHVTFHFSVYIDN